MSMPEPAGRPQGRRVSAPNPLEKNLNNDRHRAVCKALLVSGLWVSFAGFAHASLVSSTSAGYAEPHTGNIAGTYGPIGVVSSIAVNGSRVAAGAYAESAYGALRTSSDAAMSGDAWGIAQSSSTWNDNVTVHGAFTGPVTVRGTFFLSGGLASLLYGGGTVGYANSAMNVSIDVDGQSVFNIKAQLVRSSGGGFVDVDQIKVEGNNVSYTPGVLGGMYSFDMLFSPGTTFGMYAQMNTLAQVFGEGRADGAQADSNFASTGYWGGMSDMRLADGTVVNDFTVTSDSGFDWAHPYAITTHVPEPGSCALVLAGLALLRRSARRRIHGPAI